MRPTTPGDPASTEHRRNLIVWVAMLWSLVLYFAIMRVAPPTAPQENPALVTALIVAACAAVALSFALKNVLLAKAREKDNPGLRQTGQIAAMAVCESGALMGVIAWYLTGSPRSYYPLIIAFIGVLLQFPARDDSGQR